MLHIDDFGNIITNISNEDVKVMQIREGDTLHLRLKNQTTRLRFCAAYGEVPAKSLLALVGSHGFLEVSVNQGNAAKKFKVKAGDALLISLEGGVKKLDFVGFG